MWHKTKFFCKIRLSLAFLSTKRISLQYQFISTLWSFSSTHSELLGYWELSYNKDKNISKLSIYKSISLSMSLISNANHHKQLKKIIMTTRRATPWTFVPYFSLLQNQSIMNQSISYESICFWFFFCDNFLRFLAILCFSMISINT